jgi:hypothetical protein
MSNRKRARAAKSAARPAVVLSDYGAVLARVVVEEVADPGQPNRTIRRAQVVPLYVGWWKKGGISDEMREAADRYAITCEHEHGARDRGEIGMPSNRAPHTQGHPLMSQVQAAASLRAAHASIGPDACALLRLYVRDNLPLDDIARRRHERKEVTIIAVRGALGGLVSHWGM